MRFDVTFGGHASVGACPEGFLLGEMTISSKQKVGSRELEREAREAVRKAHPGCVVTGIEVRHGR